MSLRWRVVVADDQVAEKVKKELAPSLAKIARVETLDFTQRDGDGAGTYEDRIVAQLKPHDDICLIVSDRDMSRATRYPGLSEAVLVKAAQRIGVPVGVYSAGKLDDVLERARSGGDGRIVLKYGPQFVEDVAQIAAGMISMRALLEEKGLQFRGPAHLLAAVLNEPLAEEHLALYMRGDQRMVSEFLSAHAKTGEESAKQVRRAATSIGTWFFDSVLRFPGVILDSVACASFLGVAATELLRKPVVAVLSDARYSGPFAVPDRPFWWRHKLNDLLAKAGVDSGYELLRRARIKNLKHAKCCVRAHSRAGFYCVLTKKAVCGDDALPISWLPRGADLCRVRSDVYEELAPWVGL